MMLLLVTEAGYNSEKNDPIIDDMEIIHNNLSEMTNPADFIVIA